MIWVGVVAKGREVGTVFDSQIFIFMKYLPVLYLVSGIILVIWVNLDCASSGQDALFWSIVVLIFNLPGIILYYIVTHVNNGPGPKRRELVMRDKDDELRKKYTRRKAGYPDQPGVIISGEAFSEPDPDFRDPRVEKLIEEGKAGEAMKYVRELKAVAEDMGDEKMASNMKKYEARIALTSGTQVGKRNIDSLK